MQLAFSDCENVDHSPTSFPRIACSFLTQAAKLKSGPPISDGSLACCAIPRHTGSTLRSGTLCDRAGQSAKSRTTAAMGAVVTTRIGLSPRRRTQLERRDAQHDIECERALQRQRLQSDGAAGAAHKHIGAAADDKTDIARRADIFAR